VGVIPGPSEPKLNVNPYLSPLVDELLDLWNDGVKLRHHGSPFLAETFKACLLCVACDIPASRKVCGFTGHNSAHGCNKCTKTFVTGNIGGQTDYSGFESCPSRNIVEHRRQVDDVLSKTTQEERSRAESQYGVRYSELLRLPYFDCIRFTVVDPMHNLFLGTAKHVMETWMDESILSSADLQKFRKRSTLFLFRQILVASQAKLRKVIPVLLRISGKPGLLCFRLTHYMVFCLMFTTAAGLIL
jgi:hypothetical protein